MRPDSLLAAAIATLLIVSVSSPGIVKGQPAMGESYWGDRTLDAIISVLPAVAVAVLAGVLFGEIVGFFHLDATYVVLMVATIAVLVYKFYWGSLSQVFPR